MRMPAPGRPSAGGRLTGGGARKILTRSVAPSSKELQQTAPHRACSVLDRRPGTERPVEQGKVAALVPRAVRCGRGAQFRGHATEASNPSIERTAPSSLRELASAAHVER